MIMPIRLNQPFTLPIDIKYVTRSNLKILYPYFHRRIIESDGKIHNTLNENCIEHDKNLKQLVDTIDGILKTKPFEAYFIINTNTPEKIRNSGYRIPAKSIFINRCLKRLSNAGFPEEKIELAEKILNKYNEDYLLDFFMPMDNSCNNSDSFLYHDQTTMHSIFYNSLPEALNYLNSNDNLYLVRFIIRYKDFNEQDKNHFIIEILKYFTYQLMTDYDYPLFFKSTTAFHIKKSHIIDVTKKDIRE